MNGVFKCVKEDDERRSGSVKRSSLGMPPCNPKKYSRILKRLSLGMPHWIRPKCITILYSNSFLFIDIFHVMMLFLCCFGLIYIVCNFLRPKQQTQDSTVKSGR